MKMVLLFFIFLLLIAPGVQGGGKVTLSRVEEVILLPWGIKLTARIDTGATVTSLDARDLRIDGDEVEFRLSEEYGGRLLRLPIAGWHRVRSPMGRQQRPAVEVDLCIASHKVRVKANLNDRSMVKYPIILGRNALKGHFVVDVERRPKTVPPICRDQSDRQEKSVPSPPLQTSNE